MTPYAPPATNRVVTGEAVEFEIRIARLGSRALARLVDLIAQLVLAVLLVIAGSSLLAAARVPFDPALAGALLTVLIVVVLVGYPVLLEAACGGRTPGKFAMGLRVVRDDAGPVRFRHALTRALVGVAVEWPGLLFPPVTWATCLWTMMANPQGKRVGDLAAGTIVIHERTPAAWGWAPFMPVPLAAWATSLDLTGLPDDLALAVRHYMSRYRSLREPARGRLGLALAGEVAACTTPAPPRDTPVPAYLAAVLAERNRRAMLRISRARSATAAVWPELARAVQPPPPPWAAPWPYIWPAPQPPSGGGPHPSRMPPLIPAPAPARGPVSGGIRSAVPPS